MFRPLRRSKNAISEAEARQLLKNEKRGVFAVNGDDGYPFAVPVDFYYEEEGDKIYFHGAKSGLKVDSLKRNDKVCFTVYGNEYRKEGDWAPYVQCALCYGRCRLIDDMAVTEEKLRTLALKYYPTREEVEEEMKRDISRAQLYEITIEHISGKQVHEK